MLKDLVVNLAIHGGRDAAAEYAVSIAATFEAHVSGIAFAYEPVIPGTVFGSLPADFIAASEVEARKAADGAVRNFIEIARRGGVSSESHMFDATMLGASDMFGSIARRFDLAVVGQPQPDHNETGDLIIEAALFASGRPVIVVPYIHKEALKLDRVLVCWDGSRTAARAVGDAVPFLERAKSIELIVVKHEAPKSDELPGVDMAGHLSRHGLTIEVKSIIAPGSDVANTILSHAADAGSDLMVMGGYGHSRLREFVLGGATRGILGSMTVPVLMSH